MTTEDRLARLRALVFAEPGLQARLGAEARPEALALLAAEAAAVHGIPLAADELSAVLASSLGASRRGPAAPITDARWPPGPWLPSHAGPHAVRGFSVDWCYFGERKLREPFFDWSRRAAADLPINRLLPVRMALEDFVAAAETDGAPAPTGFIFHLSRCGSTLAAQMLAARDDAVVVSEAPPLDEMVQLDLYSPGFDPDIHARCVKAMVAALGRRRRGGERLYVVKLDSWHTLALPLFRHAFPDTPWVFLYREPLEVLVSQMRQRGMQTVPGSLPSRLYGLDFGLAPEEYCAGVIGRFMSAALKGLDGGGGLLVDYSELPEALWTRILPHFGAPAADGDIARMRLASTRNAKSPHLDFAADGDGKRREASDAVRRAAERLAPVYGELERRRAQQLR